MSTCAYTRCLLALALASGALPVRGQGLPANPAGASPDPKNRQADPARAARKAQLMAEFRALLEQGEARQDVQPPPATTAPNAAAMPDMGATRASTTANTAPPAAAAAGTSQAPAVRWPKDPGLDYTGLSCEYFTRPPLASSTALIHPEGSWVAYGERMYQCLNQRWRMAGPVAAYADGAQRQAALVEH